MVEFGGCFEPRQPSCDSGEGEGYFRCLSYNRLEAFAFGLEIHPEERKTERQRPGCTWACQKREEGGNWSRRKNRRFSPNRSLMRSWWRTVSTIDVFPIPPAPVRAMGSRFSARPTMLWMSSSRPKQALGGGGGDSPSRLNINMRRWFPLVVSSA